MGGMDKLVVIRYSLPSSCVIGGNRSSLFLTHSESITAESKLSYSSVISTGSMSGEAAAALPMDRGFFLSTAGQGKASSPKSGLLERELETVM